MRKEHEWYIGDFTKYGEVKNSKSYIKIIKDDLIASVQNNAIFLQSSIDWLNFKAFSEEEISKRHLGNFKYLAKFKNDNEIFEILNKYFGVNFNMDEEKRKEFEKEFEATKLIDKKPVSELKKIKTVKVKTIASAVMPTTQVVKQPCEREVYHAFLNNLTDIDLIKLYRTETVESKQNQIFTKLIFRKDQHNYSWDTKIKNHIRKNKHKIEKYSKKSTEDDLYEDIMENVIETVKSYFDVDSGFKFSTYMWCVITNTINRELQGLNYKKRKKTSSDMICIDMQYDEGKMWDEVISSENVGRIKALDSKTSFEHRYSLRSLIDYIKNDILKAEYVDVNKELEKEMIEVVNNKKNDYEKIKNLAHKYNMRIGDVFLVKDKIVNELKKKQYLDLINNIEHDIDDGVFSVKHNCSKSQVTSLKSKLNKHLREEMLKLELGLEEIFNQ